RIGVERLPEAPVAPERFLHRREILVEGEELLEEPRVGAVVLERLALLAGAEEALAADDGVESVALRPPEVLAALESVLEAEMGRVEGAGRHPGVPDRTAYFGDGRARSQRCRRRWTSSPDLWCNFAP